MTSSQLHATAQCWNGFCLSGACDGLHHVDAAGKRWAQAKGTSYCHECEQYHRPKGMVSCHEDVIVEPDSLRAWTDQDLATLRAQAECLVSTLKGEMMARRRAKTEARRAERARRAPVAIVSCVGCRQGFARVDLVRTHLAAKHGLLWLPPSQVR